MVLIAFCFHPQPASTSATGAGAAKTAACAQILEESGAGVVEACGVAVAGWRRLGGHAADLQELLRLVHDRGHGGFPAVAGRVVVLALPPQGAVQTATLRRAGAPLVAEARAAPPAPSEVPGAGEAVVASAWPSCCQRRGEGGRRGRGSSKATNQRSFDFVLGVRADHFGIFNVRSEPCFRFAAAVCAIDLIGLLTTIPELSCFYCMLVLLKTLLQLDMQVSSGVDERARQGSFALAQRSGRRGRFGIF
mmetsp:Transcript_31139/g.66987  ORF Transcript_31139/g.66987 Transcript_31139/m.66987 type:complete len:249 (-) Transcript_31139:399-1145(-)